MGDGEILWGSIGYALKRAQHALRLEMDVALRRVGLTTPQYAALTVLEDEAGISGAELARRCFVTPQTMNGIVTNLETAGLMERRAHPGHGRVLQAYLTGEGEAVVSRAHASVWEVEERMLGDLGGDERAWLLRALQGCADALEREGTGRRAG